MVIVDYGEAYCMLFIKCDASDGGDNECLWSDFDNEYYFIVSENNSILLRSFY